MKSADELREECQKQVWEDVASRLWNQIQSPLENQVRNQVEFRMYNRLAGQTEGASWGQVWTRLRDHLVNSL